MSQVLYALVILQEKHRSHLQAGYATAAVCPMQGDLLAYDAGLAPGQRLDSGRRLSEQ